MPQPPPPPPPTPGKIDHEVDHTASTSEENTYTKKISLFSLLRRGRQHTVRTDDPDEQHKQQQQARREFWRKVGGRPNAESILNFLHEENDYDTHDISDSKNNDIQDRPST